MLKQYFDYSPEVCFALERRKPILALESTIISHGMPYPENYETAIAVEEIVREHNVTPATIAIMHGKIKIGLSATELKEFASDPKVIKASKRDLPFALSQSNSAGTTVSATLFCARHAGIKLFATGGIGGVHRGDENDISADLIEIAKSPIAVICAGAKAILDLPKTLEFLETMSVPVIGYKTKVLPAFYTATTSHTLHMHVDDVTSLANILNTHWKLEMNGGVLITNPIPDDFNIPAHVIEPVIAQAVEKASQNNITGKALTPFLLAEISGLTQGKSLQANIALIKNNARLGAEISTVCYNRLC